MMIMNNKNNTREASSLSAKDDEAEYVSPVCEQAHTAATYSASMQ